jgi:hypothetical protein
MYNRILKKRRIMPYTLLNRAYRRSYRRYAAYISDHIDHLPPWGSSLRHKSDSAAGHRSQNNVANNIVNMLLLCGGSWKYATMLGTIELTMRRCSWSPTENAGSPAAAVSNAVATPCHTNAVATQESQILFLLEIRVWTGAKVAKQFGRQKEGMT